MEFYGLQMGMTRQDIMDTPIGEIYDMMACFYITRGVLLEVHRHTMDYDDAIALK
jgi:hypothetical protein